MAGKIRVAVVGVGHLGRFHAQKYAALPHCELVAVVDVDRARAKAVSRELGVAGYTTLAPVLAQVDAVSIATPTRCHHSVGRACLEAGKHTLMEKPIAADIAQGEELIALARSRGVVLQVGYLERFNPAFVACQPRIAHPQYIESVRISSYAGRGVDVDVVLDLMSHDLDLVTSLVSCPLRDLHAVGISLMTSSTDLAHVHIVFENGCVANLTASRISAKAERKMRLFQPDRYFSMDFARPAAREYVADRGSGDRSGIREVALKVNEGDALLAEIEGFLRAIATGAPPVVRGEDGLRAMALADRVTRDIARNALA